MFRPFPCDTIHFMVRLFYTVIPAGSPASPGPVPGTAHAKHHEAAWRLLGSALHREDPERFPSPDPAALPEIIRTERGKPCFADKDLPQFSLSHSGDLAVCGIDDLLPVGVDVQRIETRIDTEGVSRRFFHPKEQELLQSLSDKASLRETFFRIFSAKEAHTKRTGRGLSEDFNGFFADIDRSVISDGRDGRVIDHLYSDAIRPDDIPDLYALAVCLPADFSVPEIVRINL